MAVDLWTEVTVERADKFEIIATGLDAEHIPTDETNHLVTGVKAAFLTAGRDMPILKYSIVSQIPFARGLGSSSAAIVAGIIAGVVILLTLSWLLKFVVVLLYLFILTLR